MVGGRPLTINTSTQCRHSEDSSLQNLRSWLGTRLWALLGRLGSSDMWGSGENRRLTFSPVPGEPSTALPDPETTALEDARPQDCSQWHLACRGLLSQVPSAVLTVPFIPAHRDHRWLLFCLFAFHFSTEYPGGSNRDCFQTPLPSTLAQDEAPSSGMGRKKCQHPSKPRAGQDVEQRGL